MVTYSDVGFCGRLMALALLATAGVSSPTTAVAQTSTTAEAADVLAIVEPLIQAETAKIKEASEAEATRLGERLDAMRAELEALREERRARDNALATELAAMAARVNRVAAEIVTSERVTVRRMTDRDADMAEALDQVSAELASLAERVGATLDADQMRRLLSEQEEKRQSEIERIQAMAENAEISAAAAVERATKSAKAASVDIDRLRAAFSEKADAIAALKNDLAIWRTQPAASATPAATPQEGQSAEEAEAAPSRPAPTDRALVGRMEALEARAAEAIAILDQRIDQIAKEAQPRAASLHDSITAQLAGMSVRFSSSAEPASRDTATATLQKVAEIALGLPETVRLRIVGYADSDGTVEANRITSKRRSDWALDQLVALGVPPTRMTSVGRGAEQLLSADASDDSPNRRVEFEAYTVE